MSCTTGRKYLMTDRLHFGDVILTRSKRERQRSLFERFESLAIAMMGGGKYSHAALVVQAGRWYDSDNEGIGENSFPAETIHKVEKHGDSVRAYVNTRGYGAFAVFRHPDFKQPENEAEHLHILLQLFQHHGTQYPPLTHLVDAAAAVPEWLRPFAKKVLPYLERKIWGASKPRLPGPFCSELVAGFYRRLGIPLFNRDRDPTMVNPNDLAKSRLRRICDCFGRPDPSLPDIAPDKLAFFEEYCQMHPEGKVGDVRDRVQTDMVIELHKSRMRAPRFVTESASMPAKLRGRYMVEKSDGSRAGSRCVIGEAEISLDGQVIRVWRVIVDSTLPMFHRISVDGDQGQHLELGFAEYEPDHFDASFTMADRSTHKYRLIPFTTPGQGTLVEDITTGGL